MSTTGALPRGPNPVDQAAADPLTAAMLEWRRAPAAYGVARTAQRSFAAAARRFANVSTFVERITSFATSE